MRRGQQLVKTMFASLSSQTLHRIELCHYIIMITPLVFSVWGNMWGFLQSYHPSFPSKFSKRGNLHESPFAQSDLPLSKHTSIILCHICEDLFTFVWETEEITLTIQTYSALMTYRHSSICFGVRELRLHVDVCIYLSEKCTIWIIARTGICFSDIFFSSRTNYSNKYKIIFFDLGVCQSTNGCCYLATAELTECYQSISTLGGGGNQVFRMLED